MGGGNDRRALPTLLIPGLSPRGRGKPAAAACAHRRARSIPAWAGETKHPWELAPFVEVYPRVGGGNVPVTIFE